MRATDWLLVRVTGSIALVVFTTTLSKFNDIGDSVTGGSVPVPLRLMTCGLPPSLSVNVSVPVCAPATVGSKVALMVQYAPTVNEPLQSSLSPKPALGAMLSMVRGACEVLVSTTCCAALVLLTGSLPKARVVGARLRHPGRTACPMTAKTGFGPDPSEKPRV